MHLIYFYTVFLLDLFGTITCGLQQANSNNQTFHWSCSLSSERRLECRNLFNFYLSSYSLCANDYQLFRREKIDEVILTNDYNCLDHSYQCYFEFDSTWSACFASLRKLTVENLSFVVRLYNSRRLLPLDYLKIVNTHGSITELLHLFQFSNRSSVYIENFYPRWSGMDLYSLYLQYSSIVFKQFWVNVYDWYPIAYMRYDQQMNIRQWLTQIPCLHIELGDCRSYNYDMIFLRDLFGMRQEISNELYCYKNRGSDRYHWSRVPELYYNYVIPRRSPSNLLQMTELHEQCFNQFTKSHYTINSYTDLEEFYSHFRSSESSSIPLLTVFPYATLANLPSTSTMATTMLVDNRPSSYPSTVDYINIYDYASALNESRWLSAVEDYPDGRFLIVDNRNQQLLLLNENGTYRIDLTSIFFHQIQLFTRNSTTASTIHHTYSFAQIHIDQDSYVYLIPTQTYYIYVFSQENRLARCLTPRILGISIIRSDCVAVTHTGLIYVCDDAYRSIRIYTRMGIHQRTMRLNFLPLKLLISNTRMFTYSIESLASIQMYTLAGSPVRTLTMCSYNIPSEVTWFRGKYFLTCGTHLYVLDEQGEQIAEHSLSTLLDTSESILTVHDFALNKNGQMLVTFRRNGTLFNRYWIIRPSTF